MLLRGGVRCRGRRDGFVRGNQNCGDPVLGSAAMLHCTGTRGAAAALFGRGAGEPRRWLKGVFRMADPESFSARSPARRGRSSAVPGADAPAAEAKGPGEAVTLIVN